MDDLKRRVSQLETDARALTGQINDIHTRLTRSETHVDALLNTMREIREDTKFTKRTIVKTLFSVGGGVIIAVLVALLNL